MECTWNALDKLEMTAAAEEFFHKFSIFVHIQVAMSPFSLPSGQKSGDGRSWIIEAGANAIEGDLQSAIDSCFIHGSLVVVHEDVLVGHDTFRLHGMGEMVAIEASTFCTIPEVLLII